MARSPISVLLLKIFKSSILPLSIRHCSNTVGSKLVFSKHGDPAKVIHKKEYITRQPEENEVLVKVLAAPIHPVDINYIEGKYPLKPTDLPAVPGNEAVGEVLQVGPGVSDLSAGDHVVTSVYNLGTWRTHLTLSKDNFFKVPKKLGLVEAATLTANPLSAYRMLKDFVSLKPGDTVIQNGANSACGQNIIQICRSWGVRTVNVVRTRPKVEELKYFLTNLGATKVFTEEEVSTTNIFKSGELEKPKLALDCVGGKSASEIMGHLRSGGKMVKYGGMSREPVIVTTSALVFKDISVSGFWMQRWSQENPRRVEKIDMFKKIVSMLISGELHGPVHKIVPFENYREALVDSMSDAGRVGKKFVLDFSST